MTIKLFAALLVSVYFVSSLLLVRDDAEDSERRG